MVKNDAKQNPGREQGPRSQGCQPDCDSQTGYYHVLVRGTYCIIIACKGMHEKNHNTMSLAHVTDATIWKDKKHSMIRIIVRL